MPAIAFNTNRIDDVTLYHYPTRHDRSSPSYQRPGALGFARRALCGRGRSPDQPLLRSGMAGCRPASGRSRAGRRNGSGCVAGDRCEGRRRCDRHRFFARHGSPGTGTGRYYPSRKSRHGHGWPKARFCRCELPCRFLDVRGIHVSGPDRGFRGDRPRAAAGRAGGDRGVGECRRRWSRDIVSGGGAAPVSRPPHPDADGAAVQFAGVARPGVPRGRPRTASGPRGRTPLAGATGRMVSRQCQARLRLVALVARSR